MPKTQDINVTAIIQYMAVTTGRTKGVPVEDVIAGTGLSRSTVYRIIREHPAIKRMEKAGKRKFYWLDMEMIENGARMPNRAKSKDLGYRLKFHGADAGTIVYDQTWDNILQGMRNYSNPDKLQKFAARWAIIADTVETALAFQRENGEHLRPAEIIKCREQVEALLAATLPMQLMVERIKSHPAYMNDEEFWSIFEAD